MLIANKQDLMKLPQKKREVSYKQGIELSSHFTKKAENTQDYCFREVTCISKDCNYMKIKEVLEISIHKVWDRSIKLDSYITEAQNSHQLKQVEVSRDTYTGNGCELSCKKDCSIF